MTKYKFLVGELPFLNDTAIAVMSAGQFLSGEKAKRELDYEPKISVDEMLEKTIHWFRSQDYIK